jgi:hypothetical protein
MYQNKSLYTEYSMFSIQPLSGSNSDEKLRTYEKRRDIKKTLSHSKNVSHDSIPLVSGPELAIDKIPAPKGEI